MKNFGKLEDKENLESVKEAFKEAEGICGYVNTVRDAGKIKGIPVI